MKQFWKGDFYMLDKNYVSVENKRVGEGEVRQLIEKKILFNPPKKDVVIGVGEILKTVQITDTNVFPDYVVVNGFLNKSILYKTAKRPDAEKFLGEEEPEEMDENGEREGNKEKGNNKYRDLYRGEDKEDNKENKNKENNKDNKKEDNKEGNNKEGNNKEGNNKDDKNKEEKKGAKCESLAPECAAIDGVVRHITTWIPFESLVRIEGALPGDVVEVLSVEVLDSLEEDIIEYGNFIIGIIEKDIVKIKVRVTRAK
jgi:hypothetical protein